MRGEDMFGRVVDGFRSKLLSVASFPQCCSDVIGQIVARVLWGSFVDSVPPDPSFLRIAVRSCIEQTYNRQTLDLRDSLRSTATQVLSLCSTSVHIMVSLPPLPRTATPLWNAARYPPQFSAMQT